ncbi:hypothetical protein [Parapedobacter pyrenivorans]|uniref:hypothetical protein n=1 Tax=Parapedobacter pyrenivorans TaxID=1305674 RepID=UPI0033426695
MAAARHRKTLVNGNEVKLKKKCNNKQAAFYKSCLLCFGYSLRGLLLAFVLLPAVSVAYGQSFRAGAAIRVITPDPLLPVSGGVGPPRPTHIQKGDLFVRALVLESSGTRIAFVSIDNLGWPAVLGDRARAMITGIPPENILIGATHTHSAPDAYGFPDEHGVHHADLAYLDFCVRQMADAVNEAVRKLEPATLKVAMGAANGRIAFNYYAEELYDPRCSVMQAVAMNGNVIATLVNYAVHPETIGSKRGVLSPDLCGPLYERIEDRVGGVALFMNGALGGMVTADNRQAKSEETSALWAECVRIGTLLADEAIRLIHDGQVVTDPELRCLSKQVTFPVETTVMQYILNHSPLSYPSPAPNQITTRINAVKVGPATILTIPGEALPNIGYYLKRKMKSDYPFLFGLTNDAFGYMLTKVDFDSFQRYAYITRTSLGEMTGEIYIDEALALVTALYHE